MKIVQVPRRFDRAHWGGAETVVLETSRRLIGLGHETSILTTNALAGSDAEQIGGVDVRRVPYFYPYLGLSASARRELDQQGGNLFSLSLMRALWRERGLGLVHLHTGKRLGGAVRVVARARRVPYIVSLHGGFLHVPREESSRYTQPTRGAFEWGRALGWMVGSRRVLDDAAAIVCVSRHERDRLRPRFGDKVTHLPNGVDPARFATGDGQAFRARHGIGRAAFLVAVVGRIDPQKNQLVALGVLERLRAAGVDAHLALVGPVTNDAYAHVVRAQAEARRLTPHLTLTGNLAVHGADLAGAYHAADVHLLPSVHEPFGIAVLEAWAARKPVVAAAVGGIPELIRDGREGLLFPSGDEARAAQAVLSLARDPARRAALAGAGHAAVGGYTWDRVTARLVELYRQVLEQGRATSTGSDACVSA